MLARFKHKRRACPRDSLHCAFGVRRQGDGKKLEALLGRKSSRNIVDDELLDAGLVLGLWTSGSALEIVIKVDGDGMLHRRRCGSGCRRGRGRRISLRLRVTRTC